MGLNLYESRAYLALLTQKTLTAKGLGNIARIPHSRTYDILVSLTEKGFAVSNPTSPATYVPVTPGRILTSCYNSQRKKVQEPATRVQEEAAQKLERLRDAYESLIKELPNMTAQTSAAKEEILVIQKRENIERAMIALIQEAKSDLLRITKPPEPRSRQQFDPFYIVGMENRKFVFDALESGVRMRWLSLEREIPSFVGLEVNEPPERRYLKDDDDVTEKFFLVDNEQLLLNLHDPLSHAFGSVALMMRSRAAASIFLEHFEKMWERARPLGEVLPRARLLVDDVCGKLGELGLGRAEIQLLKAAARAGASSQDVLVASMSKRKVGVVNALASLEKLMKLGLVHRDSTLGLFIVEHPANIIDSIKKGTLNVEAHSRGHTTRPGSSGNKC
jgi:sugar-specific transcriptional regulator TrmB